MPRTTCARPQTQKISKISHWVPAWNRNTGSSLNGGSGKVGCSAAEHHLQNRFFDATHLQRQPRHVMHFLGTAICCCVLLGCSNNGRPNLLRQACWVSGSFPSSMFYTLVKMRLRMLTVHCLLLLPPICTWPPQLRQMQCSPILGLHAQCWVMTLAMYCAYNGQVCACACFGRATFSVNKIHVCSCVFMHA